ncbi:hypothetical protein [Sodalis sp. (in: enterobacteria)]
MPCTAWADQKWSTIPRSYLVIMLLGEEIIPCHTLDSFKKFH